METILRHRVDEKEAVAQIESRKKQGSKCRMGQEES
jgi:hypothetical protein